MPAELFYLALSAALYGALILVQTIFGNFEHSIGVLLGPRDGLVHEGKYLCRAQRTLANMTEAMIMFAPLTLIAAYTDRLNDQSALAAMVFFWARLAYAPLYLLGVPVARTLVWFAGVAAILLMFKVAVFG